MGATERIIEMVAEIARRVDEGELLTRQGITQIRKRPPSCAAAATHSCGLATSSSSSRR
jgi:hypothetical protein